MTAVPIAEAFLRSTLLAMPSLASLPVEPAPYTGEGIAVAYRNLTSSDPKNTSDGQALYTVLKYQVVATKIAKTISALVPYQLAIHSALHFDFDRAGLLPVEIHSCQCEREIPFPETTSRGDVRQNLGYVVRLVVVNTAVVNGNGPLFNGGGR